MSWEPKTRCPWCRRRLDTGGWHPECKVANDARRAEIAAGIAERHATMTADEIAADRPWVWGPPAPAACVKPACPEPVEVGSRYCPAHKATEEAAQVHTAQVMANWTGWCPECRGTCHAKRTDGWWDLDDICAACGGTGKAA